MTIVGTRPELIKMSRVIAEFDKHTHHVLVHTGQNFDYELNRIFFEELDIRAPDYFLEAVGKSPIQTIARILETVDEVLEKENPDAVLIYGDTNSGLAVIAAKRRKIPVFHMEAGNRCFDQRVPEELNRKVLDHLSDINLVLAEHSRRYLIAEGLPAEQIIKTGSHMPEVLSYFMPKIKQSEILSQLSLKEKHYFLLSIHREENVDVEENLHILLEAMQRLVAKYDIPIIVSTHPRTRKRLEEMQVDGLTSRIQFLKPFGFLDYIRLQMGALCILSDSGTITEEASLLDLPAVTIREAHERPEGMDEGTLIMTGLKLDNILDAVNIIVEQHHSSNMGRTKAVVPDYAVEQVSKKILNIVFSYVHYINRMVWHKPERG